MWPQFAGPRAGHTAVTARWRRPRLSARLGRSLARPPGGAGSGGARARCFFCVSLGALCGDSTNARGERAVRCARLAAALRTGRRPGADCRVSLCRLGLGSSPDPANCGDGEGETGGVAERPPLSGSRSWPRERLSCSLCFFFWSSLNHLIHEPGGGCGEKEEDGESGRSCEEHVIHSSLFFFRQFPLIWPTFRGRGFMQCLGGGAFR